jgi:hypothetical protein
MNAWATSYLVFQWSTVFSNPVVLFVNSVISCSSALLPFLPGFFGSSDCIAASDAFSIARFNACRLTANVRQISVIGRSPLRAISTTRYRSCPVMSFHFIGLTPSLPQTVFVYFVWCAHPDHLVNHITHFDLDVVTLACYPNIRLSKFAKKIQRLSSLLAKSKSQGILSTSLFQRFFHIPHNTVETVRRTRSSNALMRTLVVIVGYPVSKTLARIRKGGKHGIREKLLPYRTPEPLDLP